MQSLARSAPAMRARVEGHTKGRKVTYLVNRTRLSSAAVRVACRRRRTRAPSRCTFLLTFRYKDSGWLWRRRSEVTSCFAPSLERQCTSLHALSLFRCKQGRIQSYWPQSSTLLVLRHSDGAPLRHRFSTPLGSPLGSLPDLLDCADLYPTRATSHPPRQRSNTAPPSSACKRRRLEWRRFVRDLLRVIPTWEPLPLRDSRSTA